MKLTRIKIIQNDSKIQLQNNVNTYMQNIIKLHAQIIGQPQIHLLKINPQWLKKYVRVAMIMKYNQKHPKFSLKPSANLRQVGKLTPQLIKQIKRNEMNISPIQFYAQICYQVDSKVLKAHSKVFK